MTSLVPDPLEGLESDSTAYGMPQEARIQTCVCATLLLTKFRERFVVPDRPCISNNKLSIVNRRGGDVVLCRRAMCVYDLRK